MALWKLFKTCWVSTNENYPDHIYWLIFYLYSIRTSSMVSEKKGFGTANVRWV